ncbi:MAG TPA: UDP-N-acetylglucosamine 1-carboxyvinyltransferase [Chitinophagaceae bacterium]|nr:UDP-N-acetylglucosamine 1-carboxyvinyltransferase [Chitinophagaceae bacterium]
MNNAFEVKGGKSLHGEVIPQGAKNEALQVICACLLTSEKVTLHNLPDIRDVNQLIELMQDMGVKTNRKDRHICTFQADNINFNYLDTDTFQDKASKLRGSVMIAGPLLARFRKARFPQPGGDKIGRRPLDTHLRGFQKMGAEIHSSTASQYATIEAPKGLNSTYLLLDEPSITGTANLMMASVFSKGITTLYNAACEPYIQQLCTMLQNMGAQIDGIGSNKLIIKGVSKLSGTQHSILPDMIEIGSFIGLAAMTQSEITIKNAGVDHLGIIPSKFKQLGINLQIQGDDIYIPKQETYELETYLDGSVLTIYDHPWPGFTPDLLSIVLVTAIQAKGSVLIHQKMFESRLFFVDKLISMGAQIILCDPHRAVVVGLNRSRPLQGVTMSSPDIRAGVALLIAALSAEGTSIIQNAHQIDRGYQNIEGRLQKLGAEIRRID